MVPRYRYVHLPSPFPLKRASSHTTKSDLNQIPNMLSVGGGGVCRPGNEQLGWSLCPPGLLSNAVACPVYYFFSSFTYDHAFNNKKHLYILQSPVVSLSSMTSMTLHTVNHSSLHRQQCKHAHKRIIFEDSGQWQYVNKS